MRKTRNLFVIIGKSKGIVDVLSELKFKGLMVLPPEEQLSEEKLSEVYNQNRSLVCSVSSLDAFHPDDAITINVVETSKTVTSISNKNVIYLDQPDIAKQFAKIAEEHDLDIGDHKSNSSGVEGTPSRKDCAYCQYLDGHSSKNERTIYKSESFFVIPTIGQFCLGYLLIIPIEHIMSNADLDEKTLEEFKEVLSDVEYILNLTYGKNVLIWENGSGGHGTGKAKDSVVHSHLHIVPSELNSKYIELNSKLQFEDVTLDNLHIHSEHPYLLVRSPNKDLWRICDSSQVYIPRQYVRQLVAEEKGFSKGDCWNWRTHAFSERMAQTRKDISYTLVKYCNVIPDRIWQRTRDFIGD